MGHISGYLFIWKDFGDKATNYYYNRGNIILETDKNNMATARNIRGLRLIYRENNPGQVDSQFLYYLHNAHGDVTQLLNEQGQLIKDYRYDTFGQEEMPESQVFGGKQTGELWRQEVEKIDNPFRYCGEYLDEETGNYYLRARYYDPSIQRFVNEDSYAVAFGAMWNQHIYNYVGNNPINFIDPSGHLGLVVNGKAISSTLIGSGNNAKMWAFLREMADAMGYKVYYSSSDRLVAVSNRDGSITRKYSLDAYRLVNNRLQIPVAKFAKDFGIELTWVGETKTAYVGCKPPKPKPNPGNNGTGEIKKPINTATPAPKVVPAPPPQKVKTIEQAVNEVDLSNIPSDIWKGMTCEGIKPYKQTAGAMVFGGTVIVTAGGASYYYTAGGSIMYIGNYAADVLGPPPPNSLSAVIGGKGLEWVGVDPLGDFLFGKPK